MDPEPQRLHDTIYQKAIAELQMFSDTVNEDQARLRGTQAELLPGEPAIRDVCTSVAERLRGTVHATESNVQELKKKGDPKVNKLVYLTAIVYNQCLQI